MDPLLLWVKMAGQLYTICKYLWYNGGPFSYILFRQRSDEKDPEYSSGLLAFPEGFRMLAGNPFLRNYTDTVEQQAISYACLGVSGPETPDFPTQNCPDGLRSQVFFPSCWDGVNLDSPDHKSHMAYPSIYNAGFCPPSHPKRFISIFYEVIWNTPDFADMWYDGNQPFVWASGDSTGYGFHGDFVNGWDVPTLQKAVTECNSASGVIEECKVFDFFSDQVAQGCKIPASVDEQIDGILDALPGCNPVQSGPGMAKSMSGCDAPTTIGTPQYNFVDLTVSKGFEYLGCGPDIAGQARTLGGASLTADDMTNEKCVDYCISKGFSIAGTEYTTQCFCGNSILAGREPVAGLMGNCLMPCSGDSKEFCGGGGQISLYQKCGSTCSNVVYSVNNSTSGSGTAGVGNSAPSKTGTSSVAPMATTASLELPASSEVRVGSQSSPTVGGNDDVIVVTKTRTVIPLASMPTPESTCCPRECGEPERITVTVALTTVTVTANVPGTYSATGAPTTSATDDYGPLTTLSAPPHLITPSASAPYALTNGTSSHHHSGTGHHSRIHSHATPKRHH
jgi:hypothetical protein